MMARYANATAANARANTQCAYRHSSEYQSTAQPASMPNVNAEAAGCGSFIRGGGF